MVEEKPFIKEAGISSFKKSFQKLWYSLAFSPHCPYHKHLEVIKVKANKLWSICLTKYMLVISSPLNTRATPHATQLQSPISSCHSKYMRIIENRQRGTPCTWYRSYPITKMTRQADNEHLSDLFYLLCAQIFIEDASQNAHYGYAASFHHDQAWLRLAAQAFI